MNDYNEFSELVATWQVGNRKDVWEAYQKMNAGKKVDFVHFIQSSEVSNRDSLAILSLFLINQIQ